MIILGLGSNQGDRIHYLRSAIFAIKQHANFKILHISPLYHSEALLTNQADDSWNQPYLNVAIQCETSLSPQHCLQELKKIELLLGREKNYQRWSPRPIDIDILAWDEEIICLDQLTIPHAGLLERPFALWPLADLIPLWKYPVMNQDHGKTAAKLVEKWGSRFLGLAPLKTKQIQQRILPPKVVGIINVTPDSFSDGNEYLSIENALRQAHRLIEQGAEILDIGAESTAPNARAITPDIEWQRLYPVLSAIMAEKNRFLLPPIISIDTRHASTARLALQLGIDWINDVTGFENADMCELLASNQATGVMMHHLSIPASGAQVFADHIDPVSAVYEWAMQRMEILERYGISPERIIVDPGIGFGKTASQSLYLIKHIERLQALGLRILVGHSRKSFMTLFNDLPARARDIETLAMTLFLQQKNIDYVRVHQVDYGARALKVVDLLSN